MPAGASDSFGPALEGTPVSHRWSATWLSALPHNLSNSVLQDRLCGSRTSQLADDCRRHTQTVRDQGELNRPVNTLSPVSAI